MGKINPGMKMMLMQRTAEQRSRSEYTGNGNNRRMIGYERPENGEGRQYNRGGENRYESYGERSEGYRNEGNRNESNRYEGNRSEYGGNRSEYNRNGGYRSGNEYGEMMRYERGEGGSNRYDNEYRNVDDNYGGGYESAENRRRRSRRTGRFIKGEYGGADDEDDEERRPKSHYGSEYGDIYARGTIYAPAAMNRPMSGGETEFPPVTEKKAHKWVRSMSKGEKYAIDDADSYRKSICPDCDKWEFYVAMNAMYSDHCETAKKLSMDKPDFYAMLAKDFLMDEDAGPYKLQKYMEYIPEK